MTAKIQVSGKFPDGRIFVVGGDNADELFDNLSGVLGTGEQAQRVFEDFQILADPTVGGAVNNAAPIRGAGSGAPPAAPGASAPGAPMCDHGMPRVFKAAFTSKAGKDMPSSWQCQSRDRNDQCKAKWNDA